MVRLTEDTNATKALVDMHLLASDEIAPVLGGQARVKRADPGVCDSQDYNIRKVDRRDLLKNKTFLADKSREKDAFEWFRKLYLWLAGHPIRIMTLYGDDSRVTEQEYHTEWAWRDKRSYKFSYFESYARDEIILTADLKLLQGGQVLLPDLPDSEAVKEWAKILGRSKNLLHPEILGGATDDQERNTLRGFLISRLGVQVLDTKKVCEEVLLPRILTSAPKRPGRKRLLEYSKYCQRFLMPWDLSRSKSAQQVKGKSFEFWVLDKQGKVRPAKEALFSSEFKTGENWEANQLYVPGLNFLSPKYILSNSGDPELEAWREFFAAGGVKSEPDNGVEVFAENYAEEQLKQRYATVTKVEKLNRGYDMEAEESSGRKIQIEVKGRKTGADIELTPNETEAANTYGHTFHLCIVSSIPENPTMYLVPYPIAPGIGKMEKLIVPMKIWQIYKWQ